MGGGVGEGSGNSKCKISALSPLTLTSAPILHLSLQISTRLVGTLQESVVDCKLLQTAMGADQLKAGINQSSQHDCSLSLQLGM